MSALVIPLRAPRAGPPPPLPRAPLDELHDLLCLDPVAGSAAVRTLFVHSGPAKARLAAAVCPAEREAVARAAACAVVGYDFPFAVHLLLSAAPPAPGSRERAIRTAARSAGLQGALLAVAAEAVGLAATPVAHFNAAGVRAAFFAGASVTVVSLCRLELASASEAPSGDLHVRNP